MSEQYYAFFDFLSCADGLRKGGLTVLYRFLNRIFDPVFWGFIERRVLITEIIPKFAFGIGCLFLLINYILAYVSFFLCGVTAKFFERIKGAGA